MPMLERPRRCRYDVGACVGDWRCVGCRADLVERDRKRALTEARAVARRRYRISEDGARARARRLRSSGGAAR